MAMVILTPVIFVNIITRYFFDYSLAWSSEVSRYSFVWLTFMGMAIARKDNTHAQVDLLVNKTRGTLNLFLQLAASAVVVALSLFLIIAGSRQVASSWDITAAYMRFLPMGLMYLSIPLSGLFLLLFEVEKIFNLWVGRE